MVSSMPLRDAALAAGAAIALAAAFPKIGAAWLVPFGTAALVLDLARRLLETSGAPRLVCGNDFFCARFRMGRTYGRALHRRLRSFHCLRSRRCSKRRLSHSPAHSPRIAYARMRPNVAPLGAAAAFTICEWLRSIGVLAAPFDQSDTRKRIRRCARSLPTPARTASRSCSARSARTRRRVASAHVAPLRTCDRRVHCCSCMRGVDRVAGAAYSAAHDSGRGHSRQHRTVV